MSFVLKSALSDLRLRWSNTGQSGLSPLQANSGHGVTPDSGPELFEKGVMILFYVLKLILKRLE